MTPAEFRHRLKALGLTIEVFANLTGVNPVTARGWGFERHKRGIQPFPLWVGALLTAWEREAAQRASGTAA
jgi:hypothetical protein